MEREADLDLDDAVFCLRSAERHANEANSPKTAAMFARIAEVLPAMAERVRKAEARTERLVALATRLGASEGQLARAHGDRLEVRQIQDEDALFAELIALKDRAEKAEAELAESRAATEPIVCEYCGEPATMEIMISVAGRDSRWLPRCYDHYREAEEDTREVYEHEMSHFGGAYGAPVMESRPIAGAILALQGEIAEWKARAEKAEAERDKARDLVHASMAQAVTCNEQARDRDSWKARALAAEPVAQAFADVRAFDCDEVSRILYHDVVCTAHTARMRAALDRLAAIRRGEQPSEPRPTRAVSSHFDEDFIKARIAEMAQRLEAAEAQKRTDERLGRIVRESRVGPFHLETSAMCERNIVVAELLRALAAELRKGAGA